MPIKKMILFAAALAFSVSPLSGYALADDTIQPAPTDTPPGFSVLLWPEGAPGARGDEDKDKPSLIVCLPEKPKSPTPAIVVCPGGGYGGLAMRHEGHAVTRWLNSLGMAGMILKYRLPGKGYRHPIPLTDARRAMRLVRSKAPDWNLDPERIGIMGFSAGGHLASTVGTHFDRGRKNGEDSIDRVSCRPDFMVLVYAVITMGGPTHNRGSRNNLLGPDPEKKLIEELSNELHVTSDTPPTFLVHANDDRTVVPSNSINFYLAMRKAGVPAELHVYEKGGHGFGVGGRPRRKPSLAGTTWYHRCAEWFRTRGVLE